LEVAAPEVYPRMCFGRFETNCSPYEDIGSPVVRECLQEVVASFGQYIPDTRAKDVRST